jgi:hypothetical protein
MRKKKKIGHRGKCPKEHAAARAALGAKLSPGVSKHFAKNFNTEEFNESLETEAIDLTPWGTSKPRCHFGRHGSRLSPCRMKTEALLGCFGVRARLPLSEGLGDTLTATRERMTLHRRYA